MSGFLAKLTVTPLLYTIGVLLAVLIGMSVKLALISSDLDTAVSQKATAEEAVRRVGTERDSWKDKANAASSANDSCTQGIESLSVTLDRQQKACRAAQAANQKAIAAARAEAADADATLQRFVAQFRAQTPETDCGRALAALDAACPALEGY